jgi:dipeptidyl aminopeptidase/acylaminoacyl peptidase
MEQTPPTPYGSWKSPITSDLIISGAVRLGELWVEGDAIYWLEGRPSENGRNALVRWTPSDGKEELSAAGFNVRTRVHEYGGGSYTVHDDVVYFSNFVDQRLYMQYPYTEAEPLTSSQPLRFANGVVDPTRGRLLCVREDHTVPGHEPQNSLVSLNLDGRDETGDLLASGADFYASPTLSPDADHVAWLSWRHPNMPWDGTELWVGELNEWGTAVTQATRIAGGDRESIFQPVWAPNGDLYFVSDRSNWWNLYRWHNGRITPVYPMNAEFGLPLWSFSMSTYAFADAETLIASYTRNGIWHLARIDLPTGKMTAIVTPYTNISNVRAGDGFVAFIGGAADLPTAVVRVDLTNGQWQLLRQSHALTVDRRYISQPQMVEFPTDNDLTAHAIYYPPQNGDFVAPTDERPPLLVLSHGGPTAHSSTALNLGIQYWTSRGFAVVDVNYGGSTGYGRDYRQRLYGQWGVVDVQDCLNAARYLVEQGLADGARLAIRGGSAGGYTTLCALTFHDLFAAGASHFGVSDIEALAQETHKFESRYMDSLIGPYPEMRDLYRERSPIHAVDQINCPLILFQGLDDQVVPPNQAEMMYTAVKAKGIPVAYVPFPGEQHGFRKAENIKRALDGELYFYGRIFGFKLAVPVAPVPIDNL